jgi:hypothetical protein
VSISGNTDPAKIDWAKIDAGLVSWAEIDEAWIGGLRLKSLREFSGWEKFEGADAIKTRQIRNKNVTNTKSAGLGCLEEASPLDSR